MLHAGLRDRFTGAAPGTFTLMRCRSCEAAYLDPRPTRGSIGRAYARYYTHAAPTASASLGARLRDGYLNARHGWSFAHASPMGALVGALLPTRRARWLRETRGLPVPAPDATLLDVGCGSGAFLARMRDAGYAVQGLEVDAEAVAAARAAGLSVAHGTLDDGVLELTGGAGPRHFDVVTAWHVLEHVHEPVSFLRRAAAHLKPGGRLVVATPNLGAWSHRRFGAAWSELDAPRHLVLFGERALLAACARADLEVLGLHAALGAHGIAATSAGGSGSGSPRVAEWVHDAVCLLRPSLGEELILEARVAS